MGQIIYQEMMDAQVLLSSRQGGPLHIQPTPMSLSYFHESIYSPSSSDPRLPEEPLMLKPQWAVKELKALFVSPSRA